MHDHQFFLYISVIINCKITPYEINLYILLISPINNAYRYS